MISLSFLLIVCGAHFLADFGFQSRWMAQNKSSQLNALALHILEYTTVLGILTVVGCAIVNSCPLSLPALFLWVVANGLAHFVVDYFSSRASKAAWGAGKENLFWIIIGADQLVHQICLFGLLVLLGG